MNKVKEQQKGFTLIELLIVIAIIGILTGLLTSNFISVRQRARDAQRKSHVHQIQSALELYRTDVGNYPDSATVKCGQQLVNPTNATVVYMQSIPCDPQGVSYYNGGSYQYSSSGSPAVSYTLTACLENTADSGEDVTTGAPSGGCTSGTYFTVTNP